MLLTTTLSCAALYSIKGGWLGKPKYKGKNPKYKGKSILEIIREKNKVFDAVLDGKVLTTIGAFLLWLFVSGSVPHAGWFAAFWLLGVAPSMGEEAQGIGGYRGGQHGIYALADGKMYGFKKGIQRGIFNGVCVAIGAAGLTTDISIWPILAGALFSPVYWLAISFEQWRVKTKLWGSWHWAEPIYGAILGAGVFLATYYI